MLDSVLYAYEKYYPQTFLEECKYAQEKVKTKNYTDEKLKLESDNNNDNDNDTDSDTDDEEYIQKNVNLIMTNKC